MMEEYRFKLENFEGPLDLLLHLIKKAKIEPADIFVSQITEQYLALMQELDAIDMDRGSEFLQMAATLIYIKSRSLLPAKRTEEDLDEDGLTPEEQLIRRLSEYKKYKEISEQLKELEETAKLAHYKLPEPMILEEGEIVFENAQVDLLFAAYQKMLERRDLSKASKPQPVQIYRDKYSVKKQSHMILARLTIAGSIRFSSLMSEHSTREEIAVTFMALLELLHMGKIQIQQKRYFDDISIQRREKEDSYAAIGNN